MFKKIVLIGSLLFVVLGLSACTSPSKEIEDVTKVDEEAEKALASLEAITEVQTVVVDTQSGGWSLAAPDDSARFFWSSDTQTSNPYDVFVEVDATPFIAAGLDASKLPQGTFADGKIVLGQSLKDQAFTQTVKADASLSLREIIASNETILGYHEALDHFGITVSEGFVFEWAQDMTTNDKDIVFVLDPAMFIAAGVNPEQIDGWIFAKVEVMDADMKMIEVEKLLKPFDLN